MPYRSRIKTLEESVRMLDDQIFHLEKSKETDVGKIRKLQEMKDLYNKEQGGVQRSIDQKKDLSHQIKNTKANIDFRLTEKAK